MKDKFSSSNRSDIQALNRIEEEIRKNTIRIQNAQRMMLDETISVAEYQEIKLKYEAANATLLEEKKLLENNDASKRYIKHGMELLKEPDQYYSQSDIAIKQLIIGSLFNGRLTFNETKFDEILLNSVLYDLRNH